jgi:hypothetical protein
LKRGRGLAWREQQGASAQRVVDEHEPVPARELDSGAHPGHGAGVIVAGDPADERVAGKRTGQDGREARFLAGADGADDGRHGDGDGRARPVIPAGEPRRCSTCSTTHSG